MKKFIHNLEKSKPVFLLINLVAIVYFFMLNLCTPLYLDDYSYQLHFGTQERIQNVADIVGSQIVHYFTWGGRIAGHSIDQWFLMYDKMYFNVANTIIFILLVMTIYFLVFGKKISNSFLILEYAAFWFCVPGVGTTLTWQTVSCNYLWGSTCILIFLSPYITAWENCSTSAANFVWRKICFGIWMFLTGMIAGNFLEAGGAMLLLGIGLVIVFQKREKQRINSWELSGLFGVAVGYLLLVIAPGNYARASGIEGHGNFLIEMGYRIARETYYMLLHMGILYFGIILLIILLKKNQKMRDFVRENKIAFLFFFLSLAGIYVMTASIGYAERVLLTPIVFAIVAAGCLFRKVNTEENRAAILCLACFLGIMICVMASAGLYKARSEDKILDIRTEYTSDVEKGRKSIDD